MFVDTHAHIHFDYYKIDPDIALEEAKKDEVGKVICVGCTPEDSKFGVEFVQTRENCWASIGIHPHESSKYIADTKTLDEFINLVNKPKVVAIGEIGLDYYYNHSEKKDQIKLLEFQLELAQKHNLPVIFHVREAFDDFWPIIDNFKGIRGVVHSFTSDTREMDKILSRGLYIGLNGIITFTKEAYQLEMAKAVPLQKLLLETDAPFLTPMPFRGTICQPKHVVVTARFLAELRDEPLKMLAKQTTENAEKLFNI